VHAGAYAKTGEPCPASGWWRCEESQALDGTRWFAQGSLLPAATFKVSAGAFGRGSGVPAVIQRRSSWKLVRIAQSPLAAGAIGTTGEEPPQPGVDGQPEPDDPHRI
jgi:hypothetical protein